MSKTSSTGRDAIAIMANAFSRLPLPRTSDSGSENNDHIYQVSEIDAVPITACQIAKATAKDVVLAQVYGHVMHGWGHTVVEDLKPYFFRRNELSVERGCVFGGRELSSQQCTEIVC